MPMTPPDAEAPDSPQTIARQLPPTKRAIEARQGGWTDFLQGIPVMARFRKSVRVGSANTQTALDGLNGTIVADGTLAGLFAADRGGSGNRVGLYRNGTKFYLSTNDGSATLIEFDALTGQITQDALTALTAGTNITLGASGWAAPGSRLVKPTGQVAALINLTASGAVALGAAVATLAVAHRPSSTLAVAGAKVSGGVFTPIVLGILSTGQVALETATLANGDFVLCTANFPTS